MRRGTLFWGLALVLIGLLLLLDNLGFLAGINVWSLVFPLFLIALGAWIIWGRFISKAPAREHVSIPLQGAQRVRVQLKHGAGKLQIASQPNLDDILEGDFDGGLDYQTREVGDVMEVVMKVPSYSFPVFGTPGFSLDWDCKFNPDIPFALDIETGASESQIDLKDMQVEKLHLKSGASATAVILPDHAGSTEVKIESGAASVDIRIPDGVAARIRSQSGLSSINVDRSRFPRQAEYYQSPDYETAVNKVDIFIQMGVGSANIR